MYNFQFSIPGLMELQTPGSDDLPLVIRLPNHSLSSSSWNGIVAIGPVTEDGDPMESAADVAQIEFAPTSDGRYPLHKLSSAPETGEGTILIEGDPANWLFTIPKQPLPLPIGLWYWTFKVTTVAGDASVIYRGTIIVTA